nr:UPF0280 family protein [Oceaniglobus trochenteri]
MPGDRLHLQHGPIDLVIGADGARAAAFSAAEARFASVLEELVEELPLLRSPVGAVPRRPIARTMHAACWPHRAVFVTPMAAVAGAVADTVLAAMVAGGGLTRAYVNNGGDIAICLNDLDNDDRKAPAFTLAMRSLDNRDLGRITLTATDTARGIATSGRGGRSLTMGIADQVTVLARTAAMADVAATLIANAVDLPGHPAITRQPANALSPDSDLGARPVVTHRGPISPRDRETALSRGAALARDMARRGLVDAAALFLDGQTRIVGASHLIEGKEPAHA